MATAAGPATKNVETPRRGHHGGSGLPPASAYEAAADDARSPRSERIAGDDASDELAVSFRLGMVEEKLRLIAVLDPGGLKRSGRLRRMTCARYWWTSFEIEGISGNRELCAHRRSQNSIGFTLESGPVRGIVFTRHAAADKL